MPADDRVLDARAFDELTPVPSLGPAPSPLEVDYAVAVATCNQLRLANAELQAKNDELSTQYRKVRDDRRVLAEQVKALERQMKKPQKENAP